MPNDLTTAAYVSGASNLAVNAVNAFSTAQTNKRQREFSEKMYERQRQDALADWAMQNQYNDPSQQMARLRKAGLNPNLVYGNGADAQMAAPTRQSTAPAWTPHAPQVDPNTIGNTINQIYDIRIKEAQANNLQANTTAQTEEAKLKAAQVVKTLSEVDLNKLDLSMKTQSNPVVYETLKQTLENLRTQNTKTKADTAFTLDSNRRANEKQPYEIGNLRQDVANKILSGAKTVEETKELQQKIVHLGIMNDIAEIERFFASKGLTWHDNQAARVALVALTKPDKRTPEQVKKEIQNILREIKTQPKM